MAVEEIPQERKVDRDDSPDDLEVDAEVTVHDPVAETNDLAPFHFRMCGQEFFRQAGRGLADDLQIADAGILALLVGEEVSRVLPLDIPGDPGRRVAHVLEKEGRRPVRHGSNLSRSPPASWA